MIQYRVKIRFKVEQLVGVRLYLLSGTSLNKLTKSEVFNETALTYLDTDKIYAIVILPDVRGENKSNATTPFAKFTIQNSPLSATRPVLYFDYGSVLILSAVVFCLIAIFSSWCLQHY